MLNLPNVGDYPAWVDEVLARFRSSGHFPESLSPALVAAEVLDLEARYIPYFWVPAGENYIHHRTGVLQSLDTKRNLRDQAIQNIQALHKHDLGAQITVLENFLDIDMALPREAAARA